MKISGKRVVVTGGAGFIGSHLVDLLVSKDNQVTVIDDFSTGKEENIRHHNNNIHVIKADVRDLPAMIAATREMDVIFHLAVACLRVSLYDPLSVHEVNATGSLNICRAALENKVQRVIFISSSEVYGSAIHTPMAEDHPLNPTTIYGASKLAGENYAMAHWYTYKMPVIVVRPFNAYGPREHYQGASAEVIPRFVLRLMAGYNPVIFGDGSQARDFTWVLDTARGIFMVAECDALIGEHVNIARGEEVSILELCTIIQTTLGRQDLVPKFLEEGRPGDVYRHFADISKARRLFGFEPTVDIRDGIKRYISWFRDQNIDLQAIMADEKITNWKAC